jgi:hypothetical protein
LPLKVGKIGAWAAEVQDTFDAKFRSICHGGLKCGFEEGICFYGVEAAQYRLFLKVQEVIAVGLVVQPLVNGGCQRHEPDEAGNGEAQRVDAGISRVERGEV